ncbi:Predicted arabinose efflux permease, MFS family [Actinopolyspora saharensis]|uniref:Predicted arabinose efflux permease, MFS family n=2 Tax=Actinopolyspora saharensis TaxID=995062 RepID=A0A1H1EU60_9ACTN|nr:MFS transporter [Actinopolyspora saharensis]SDQ92108.1 Predicted arabinose efflux permease, MFS family [Actinopolyspora saharensis]
MTASPDTPGRGVEQTERSAAESAADAPSSGGRGGMFRSLRERNYRYYASGQVVSLTGTWMQRAAQDWLVLELSGGSPAALGVAVALQFLPTMLFTLYAGVIADRFDKRRMLILVQSGMGLCGVALGLLDVGGLVELWQVYALALALGCFSAFDAPVRQSFVVEMVGAAQLSNAVALNSMTFNLARIVGPAVAGGLITAVGTGPVFLINGLSSGAVVLGLLLMDTARLHRAAAPDGKRGQLLAGLRYVSGRPELILILSLVFCVSTFGMNFENAFAVIARNVFDRNAAGYGLLITALAVGTLTGASLAARRAGGRPRLRLVFGGAAAFGVLESVASLMPGYRTFALALVPVGIAVMTCTTAANSTVQLTVDPAVRGRVMGLYMMLFLGGRPLGGLLSGWLAEVFNGRAPLLIGGAAVALASLAGAGVLARRSTGLPAGPG